MQKLFTRWFKGLGLVALAIMAVASFSAFTMHASASSISTNGAHANAQPDKSSFTFSMVPSPNISGCLPHASATVTIKKNSLNFKMTVNATGLAPHTGYDLFVIELPNKPFGVAWYQTDLEANQYGSGSATVQGVFSVETFSISLGDNNNIVFPATHQYHLGLWFNDPQVPFNLGCEPGQTQPVVTPFNGEQHAGIQVLNTSNFPDNAGPLSHLK
ncbi:MAG TPA: hypothetical protein VKV20_18105 [Ktedonobacteraceae bacterium]|nr:hypothetical protein [Ktedonobacteraceae bacterium]